MKKFILSFYQNIINPFKFVKQRKYEKCIKKYVNMITYALEELNKPDKWADDYTRESKRDAVWWLLQHYTNDNPLYKISTKQRIREVLDMNIKDFTQKDKIYLQILEYWDSFKRIKGF